MTDRKYPDDPVDDFPSPPTVDTDGDGREIRVRVAGTEDFEDLVEMYEQFDPADRAQGIPPIDADAVREWLDNLMSADSLSVVAEHEGRVVGHAILVPDRQDGYELAVFVLSDYQNAGIGTRLLEGLFGHAQDEGVDKVWLTVERWNEPAIALYEKIGFETSDAQSFEREMSIRLG